MCFTRQPRALFQNLNFQKCCRAEVFRCALYILTSKRVSHHSDAQLPKVLRECDVFIMLTLKCASRHSRVQFLIPHPTRWLCTRRFSEPTFRPSGATKDCTTWQFLQLFYLVAHSDILSSCPVFPFSFSSLIFFLLTPSLLRRSHHCCRICPYVGSLISKLPLITVCKLENQLGVHVRFS